MLTYFEHLTLLVAPPLDIDSMVPKNEVFSVPQFGQGPWNVIFIEQLENFDKETGIQEFRRALLTTKIRKSFTMKFVKVKDKYSMSGKAANHVKMKLNGSGSCEGNFLELTYKKNC